MNTFLDPCLCPMNGGVPKDMILRKIWWFLQMFSYSTDINICLSTIWNLSHYPYN